MSAAGGGRTTLSHSQAVTAGVDRPVAMVEALGGRRFGVCYHAVCPAAASAPSHFPSPSIRLLLPVLCQKSRSYLNASADGAGDMDAVYTNIVHCCLGHSSQQCCHLIFSPSISLFLFLLLSLSLLLYFSLHFSISRFIAFSLFTFSTSPSISLFLFLLLSLSLFLYFSLHFSISGSCLFLSLSLLLYFSLHFSISLSIAFSLFISLLFPQFLYFSFYCFLSLYFSTSPSISLFIAFSLFISLPLPPFLYFSFYCFLSLFLYFSPIALFLVLLLSLSVCCEDRT